MPINREATIRWKGYDPANLKPQSHKKVWAVCEDCDKGRWTIFYLYRPVCASCAAKKKEFSPEHRKNISIAKTGIPHSEETKSLMSTLKIQFHIDNPDAGKEQGERLRNSDVMRMANENQRGSDYIIKHHYIYDRANPEKYTMKVTRDKHAKIHMWMRKAGIKVPLINEVI